MRLIHALSKMPVIEFLGKETVFHNKLLEEEMRLLGIPIPPGMRSFFEGKDIIFLTDATFQKAFKEVYFITTMDPAQFLWE